MGVSEELGRRWKGRQPEARGLTRDPEVSWAAAVCATLRAAAGRQQVRGGATAAPRCGCWSCSRVGQAGGDDHAGGGRGQDVGSHDEEVCTSGIVGLVGVMTRGQAGDPAGKREAHLQEKLGRTFTVWTKP